MPSQIFVLRIIDYLLPVVLSDRESVELVLNSVVENGFLVEGHVVDTYNSTFCESYNIFRLSANLKSDFNASLLNEKDLLDLFKSLEQY